MVDIIKLLKESNKNTFIGVAGPGTGKSYAFKTIIESDEFKDGKILILSFINKLINDLKEDFKDFKNVEISTLHSFAMQSLGKPELSDNLDDIASEDYLFINGETIDYEEKFYENNLEEKEYSFYKERQNFYKHELELYSFNSVIHEINNFFIQNEDKIPIYDLILIDEFQDFNKSEYELIKILNKRNKIVAVGDDDQSLYVDFRKAKPDQIRDLYNDSSTEPFSLDYCYRCTEVIVNAANSLISNATDINSIVEKLNEIYINWNEKKEVNINELPISTSNATNQIIEYVNHEIN